MWSSTASTIVGRQRRSGAEVLGSVRLPSRHPQQPHQIDYRHAFALSVHAVWHQSHRASHSYRPRTRPSVLVTRGPGEVPTNPLRRIREPEQFGDVRLDSHVGLVLPRPELLPRSAPRGTDSTKATLQKLRRVDLNRNHRRQRILLTSKPTRLSRLRMIESHSRSTTE